MLGKGWLFPGTDGTHREQGSQAGSLHPEPIPAGTRAAWTWPEAAVASEARPEYQLVNGLSWAKMGSWTMGRVSGHSRRGWQGFQGCQCPQGSGRLQVVLIQR